MPSDPALERRDQPRAHLAAGQSPGEQPRDPDLTAIVVFALRHWRALAMYPGLIGLAVAALSLLLPREYTASVSFVPGDERSSLGSLSGLASIAQQFGVSASLRAPTGAFYAELASSRTVADTILNSSFANPDRSNGARDSLTLLEMLDIDAESPVQELELGREALRKRTSITTDNQTGIITLAFRSKDPHLSAGVANRYLELLNAFNYDTRQSSTRAQRIFIEGQLENARAALAEAEEALASFLAVNRSFEQSPQLRVAFDRLQRQVMLKQEILETLSRELEQARIEEVNDTPVLTAIDVAVPPYDYSFPRPVLFAIGTFLFVMLVGAAAALFRERLAAQTDADPHRRQELKSAWRAFVAETRSVLRLQSRSGHD